MISLEEAKARISRAFSPKPVGVETVLMLDGVGRVAAEDVVSPINVPPFHRSTVDGYAVKSEDTFSAEENRPVALELIGRVNVGEPSDLALKRNTVAEIVTGAPLPADADSVVMIENTSEKSGKIQVYKPVAKGENVMPRGSDIRKNETVLKSGSILSSRELGVLAALGFIKVKVFKRPKIAVISTGAEIVEPGKPLPSGKIYDINAYALKAAIIESGGDPVNFGIVEDDEEELLHKILKRALAASDAVITSGGVSVGPKDVVPKIIDKLGKPGLVVHGVAVKPGKPAAIAIIDGKPIFALPGNPTSSLLIFHIFVRPVLFQMIGRKEKAPILIKAIATEKLFSARGRRTFIMVTLSRDSQSRWLVSPVPTGQSGAITTLAKADGYVELKEAQQFVEVGEEVTVFLFKPLWD